MIEYRTYSELITYQTYEDRLNYLKLEGQVGADTFGYERYLNQKFYRSPEWRRFRDQIIIRDNGCDLGLEGYEIYGKIIIHHLNPIFPEDILKRNMSILMDPENSICVMPSTHNAIHYIGKEMTTSKEPVTRTPGDTKLW